MKLSAKLTAALTTGICALATSAAWLSHRQPQLQTEANALRSDSQMGISPATANHFSWKQGETFSFDLNSTVEMQSKDDKISDSLPAGKISTHGVYHVHVLRADANGATLATQLSDVTLTIADQRQAELESILSSNACLLQVRPNGQISSIRLPDTLSEADRTYLVGINESQVILPENPTAAKWETTETLSDSSYRCTYEVLSPNQWAKHRQSSTDNTKTLRSEIAMALDADWITYYSMEETTGYLMNNTLAMEASTTFTLQRRPNRAAMPAVLAQLANGGSIEHFTAKAIESISSADEAAHDRINFAKIKAIYGQMPLNDVLAPLTKIATDDASHADTIPAMHALRDWLLVHPEQALAIAKLTADPSLSDALTSRIIHAIELSASNPESQAALAEIIKHPADYPEGVLMQAVVAAGAVGEIKSPQLASALATMAAAPNPSDDFLVNDAALYALGNLSNDNPALRQTLGATLEAQLTSDTPGASRDTEVALNALANGRIASPTLLTKAATLAQTSPDEAVRIAALHYLGRTSSADLNLLQHALNDASESVRMEAISVLADPETATSDGIATALKLLNKPTLSDALTGHLITAIAPLQDQFPAIAPALQQARQATSSQNTLAQLNDALGL